ncbi:TonB-dependent receptor [Niabella drilacis]|uniref:Outer membrane receptor proteins, mostly Fe transport n=1 Tax=Niabella drilacis (strain DSM 25811 / CCM 8410 / CCUG 62505 / LMG 26954 / E90) TaxID=1285928 RepID=A0A1G6VVF6_NIADE|nr:TonB-dependent receptor [Niabella drilacis]SDD57403.1 Outer membrane receptor proteins, mostly Fe transport [Niabella drilacis]
MLKKYLGSVLLTLFLMNCAYGQKTTITGIVMDSSANVRLSNASVVLLQAKDSFIVADTRADKEGRFSFQNMNDTARYVLFFSYPKYTDYAHRVSMQEAKNNLFNLNRVNMILKEKLLREVLVKSRASAIKIKGDTTEYTADSFKVQPNATVEDLLKQLPGLQVDQYGNITAQGQKVKKVLVDGEEFFGDDPTLVTRNLRADMIDKVQVYDKKSDAAAFTGIDDGIKDKTINLKIKEDKNHGVFGKIEAGGGTDQHYNVQGMVNAFKGKRKMSVYGTTSDIGRVGLGSADKQKLGDDDRSSSNYDGKGLPRALSGGAHYDKKWNQDKESVNGNYKYNFMNVEGDESTISQNNLPSGFIRSESSSHFQSRNENHRANAKYIHKFDTTSTVTVYADGYTGDSKNASSALSESRRADDSRINTTESSSNSDYKIKTSNINLSWEKKLKKYGRTLSFYFNNSFTDDQADGLSRSETRFYNTSDVQDSSGGLNLHRQMNNTWRGNNLTVNYTEPLSQKLSLLLNYKLGNNESDEDRRSYNLATGTGQTKVDSLFSTKLNSTEWSNQGGAGINYTYRKLIIRANNNVRFIHLDIDNFYQPVALKRNFVNWTPTASLRYSPTQLKNYYFEYSGSNTNPDKTQLLPYRYNNSQLVTYLSNTDLNSSFTHSVKSNYNQVKNMGQTYMGANVSASITSHPIIIASVLDPSSGAYTYRYENLTGNNNSDYSVNVYYGRQIKGWYLNWGLATNGGAMYSKMNSALNRLNYSTYSLSLYTGKEKTKKYGVGLYVTGGYTLNKSSLQPEIRNNYFSYNLYPSAAVYFLKKLELHTDGNYFWQQKTQTFGQNFDRFIWNAWLGYNLLKNDQLTIKVSCNDILNQNNGYSRTANNTLFTENRYTTIRRFFMIGATWSFTKFNNLKQ